MLANKSGTVQDSQVREPQGEKQFLFLYYKCMDVHVLVLQGSLPLFDYMKKRCCDRTHQAPYKSLLDLCKTWIFCILYTPTLAFGVHFLLAPWQLA